MRAQYDTAVAAADYAASYEGWGPTARYFHSRLFAITEALRSETGGDLLDVGCGPGILVRHLLDTRPDDFRITACDRSPAMTDATARRVVGGSAASSVSLTVASIENLPFPDKAFDVVLAMGVLEYVDAAQALRETARVVKPGGLVLVTMLNPLSPYRLFEWGVYWPARRMLGRVEAMFGTPRHGARATGIRPYRPGKLRAMMAAAGLEAQDVVHYDLTFLVPPLDRVVRRWSRGWRAHPEPTVTRGPRRWMGTAYLVSARRNGSG